MKMLAYNHLKKIIGLGLMSLPVLAMISSYYGKIGQENASIWFIGTTLYFSGIWLIMGSDKK